MDQLGDRYRILVLFDRLGQHFDRDPSLEAAVFGQEHFMLPIARAAER